MLAVVVVLCLLGGFATYRYLNRQVPQEKLVPIVRTVTIGETGTAAPPSYPGEVQGRYESRLAFQVSGKINSRPVNVGDRVTSRQLLMSIDPKDIVQGAEAANAALSAAIANQELAAENARRFRTLYAGGAVSAAMRDQYDTQLDAANAALRQAQAAAIANGNQLEYTSLRSDADGVVAAITGEIGQIAAAGNPVITIVREGEREVRINVPENALASITINSPARISFWALPGIEADGHVREISPIADPLTRTYRVCVSLDEMPAQVRLGMTAKVSFTGADTESAPLLMPASAIYQIDEKPQVWVVRDNRAQRVDITIGGYAGNDVSVTSGLNRGDIVVTAGLSKLADNQEVRLSEGGERR